MTKTRHGFSSQSTRNLVLGADYQNAVEYQPADLSPRGNEVYSKEVRYIVMPLGTTDHSTKTLIFDAESDKKQRTIELNRRMASWGKR